MVRYITYEMEAPNTILPVTESNEDDAERETYRGRGDTTAEHRPGEDCVLITDGGRDVEHYDADGNLRDWGDIEADIGAKYATDDESESKSKSKSKSKSESNGDGDVAMADGGAVQRGAQADESDALAYDVGDEIAVSYRVTDGENTGARAETTGVVASEPDDVLAGATITFVSEAGSIRRAHLFDRGGGEVESRDDDGVWWTFGREVSVRMVEHQQAGLGDWG